MATDYSSSGVLYIRGHVLVTSLDTVAGLLQAENAVFYLDMIAVNTLDTIDNNGYLWEGSVLAGDPASSAFFPDIMATKVEASCDRSLDPAIHDYGNNFGINRITCCFWALGLTSGNSDRVRIGPTVGWTANSHMLHLNGDGYIRLTTDDGVDIQWDNVITTDFNWAFYVLDFEYSDENEEWTLRHSMNGSGWITETAISGQPFADLVGADWMSVFVRNDSYNGRANPGAVGVDEVVYWRDATLFTTEELQGLYDVSLPGSRPPSMEDYITESPDCDLFIEGKRIVSSSGTLFMYGWSPEDLVYRTSDLYIGGLASDSTDLFIHGFDLLQASGDLYVQGSLPSSGGVDLFIDSYGTNNGNIPLYISSYLVLQQSVDLFIHGPEPVANSGSLFMYGWSPEDLVYRALDLHMETPLFGTPQASGDLFVRGYKNPTDSNDLFINSYDIFQASGDLYMSGSPTIVTDSFDLFISGPNPISNDIDLFIRGITVIPPSSGDEGRAMDWFLKTSDHYPQIIGAFDPTVSGVSIQLWDIVDGQNISVPLTTSGCYSINDTGRWGWSTSNLPTLTGRQHQYYYTMTGDPSGTFDGQFFLEVPEDAKWAFPSSQSEYIL